MNTEKNEIFRSALQILVNGYKEEFRGRSKDELAALEHEHQMRMAEALASSSPELPDLLAKCCALSILLGKRVLLVE